MTEKTTIIGDKNPSEYLPERVILKRLVENTELNQKALVNIYKKIEKFSFYEDDITIKKSLPIKVRARYDIVRDGAYATSGFLFATGGWDILIDFVSQGVFNLDSLYKLLGGLALAFFGYWEAIQKAERKQAEKIKL